MPHDKFWEIKSLSEMTPQEWESLCDGCAKCCLLKLEDEDTGELFYSDVACRLLNLKTCRCSDYENRHKRVVDCVALTPGNLTSLPWMPKSCAYRLLSEGKPLPNWHPLLSGDAQAVHDLKFSAMDKVICEGDVCEEDLEDHIVDWVDKY